MNFRHPPGASNNKPHPNTLPVPLSPYLEIVFPIPTLAEQAHESSLVAMFYHKNACVLDS